MDGIQYNVQHLLRQRESEYVARSDFTILCGTFNVNSQAPNDDVAHWLSKDPDSRIPDIIALAFQELDMSSQAFLSEESPREGEWNTALAKTVKDVYKNDPFDKLCCVRLAGIMLVIFVRTSIAPVIDKVDTAKVGCGLLGRGGNKGGVAIRFNVRETSICFVSSHLSAHLKEIDRRNHDFRAINTRATFSNTSFENKNNEPLRINHHDIVFWMGDLNYRIDGLSTEMCKDRIEKAAGAFGDLYKNNDQLYMEMRNRRVFVSYNEGPIKFRPTYKYDPGTNQWDSSEKARTPAWCDRILWKFNDEIQDTDPVTQIVYRSHQDVFIGDHQPVSAIFNVSIRSVNQAKKDAVYKEILGDVDKKENRQRPQAEPDKLEIDFGEIKFGDKELKVVNVNIRNTGKVHLRFVFTPNPNGRGLFPDWLSISYIEGHRIPCKVSANVQLGARIEDHRLFREIAQTPSREFSDYLLLHLIGGGYTFLTVKGRLALTCFGLPLPVLNSTVNPIGSMDSSELAQMMETDRKKLLKLFPLPKEVFRLVDRLSKPDALEHAGLFQEEGTLGDKIDIRDALDLTYPGERIPGSIPAVGEVLLEFLTLLPTALIPVDLQEQCRLVSNSTDDSYAFLHDGFKKKSPEHHALFLYLLKFFSGLLRYRRDQLMVIPDVARPFAELAFRDDNKALESQVQKEKEINFILRLLAKEAGNLSWEMLSLTVSL